MRRARAQGRATRDRIGEGGGETNMRKEPQRSFRRNLGNGGDLGGKRKNVWHESDGSEAVDPKDLENRKKSRAGGARHSGLK